MAEACAEIGSDSANREHDDDAIAPDYGRIGGYGMNNLAIDTGIPKFPCDKSRCQMATIAGH